MKRLSLQLAILTMSILTVIAFSYSSSADIDLRSDPPPPHFDDYETFASLVSSKRCFDRYFSARLSKLGYHWSYAEFARRINVTAVAKEKKLVVRVARASSDEAQIIARAAHESLRDCLRVFPYD